MTATVCGRLIALRPDGTELVGSDDGCVELRPPSLWKGDAAHMPKATSNVHSSEPEPDTICGAYIFNCLAGRMEVGGRWLVGGARRRGPAPPPARVARSGPPPLAPAPRSRFVPRRRPECAGTFFFALLPCVRAATPVVGGGRDVPRRAFDVACVRPLSSSSGAPRVEGPAARRAPRAARRAPLLCCLLSVVSFSLGRVVQVEDPEFNRFKVHVTDLHAGEVDIDLAGVTDGIKAEAVVNAPMEPRLFVIDRDGDATEVRAAPPCPGHVLVSPPTTSSDAERGARAPRCAWRWGRAREWRRRTRTPHPILTRRTRPFPFLSSNDASLLVLVPFCPRITRVLSLVVVGARQVLRQSDAEEYLKHVQRLEGEILREPAVPCLSDPEDLGATQVCARSDPIDRDLAIDRTRRARIILAPFNHLTTRNYSYRRI